jgi:hypothetical protein
VTSAALLADLADTLHGNNCGCADYSPNTDKGFVDQARAMLAEPRVAVLCGSREAGYPVVDCGTKDETAVLALEIVSTVDAADAAAGIARVRADGGALEGFAQYVLDNPQLSASMGGMVAVREFIQWARLEPMPSPYREERHA